MTTEILISPLLLLLLGAFRILIQFLGLKKKKQIMFGEFFLLLKVNLLCEPELIQSSIEELI